MLPYVELCMRGAAVPITAMKEHAQEGRAIERGRTREQAGHVTNKIEVVRQGIRLALGSSCYPL